MDGDIKPDFSGRKLWNIWADAFCLLYLPFHVDLIETLSKEIKLNACTKT